MTALSAVRTVGARRRPFRVAAAVALVAGLSTGCTAAQIVADDASTRLQCAALGAVATNLPRGEDLDADTIRRLADVASAVEDVVGRLPDGESIGPAKAQLAAAAAELRTAVDRAAADPAAARAAAGQATEAIRNGIGHTRTILGC